MHRSQNGNRLQTVTAQCDAAGVGTQRRRAVRSSRSRRCRRSAAALLEVVISVSLLLLTMSVVGAVFRNSQLNIEQAEQISRARAMTEKILVELDTGILDCLEEEERERSGFFIGDEAYPNMSWKVEIEPHDEIDELLKIDISIFLGDPDGSDEDRKRLLTTRIYRPEPRGLDLEEDFGLDEDQIQELADAIPGGAGLVDFNDFDPRILAQLDLDDIKDLLPTLVQLLGAEALEGQINDLMEAAESGDLGSLQEAAEGAAEGFEEGGEMREDSE